jgi:8-amino-7-oxononanoate synthase
MPPPDDQPLDWIDAKLAALERRGLLRQRPTVEPDSDLIGFASNDYLGLARDQRLAEAARRAMNEFGWGSGASPLVVGRTVWHARLEEQLAVMEAAEAALVFTSGYAANVGAIAALVGRRDAVFSDAKNHASIIDGCRLSQAETFVYRHGDVEHLASLLAEHDAFERRLIVTDSLFSMDGDLAPLVEIAALAKQSRAMLLVDEAHATGVFGANGRGVCEHLGVESQVDVRIGTLSKALGSIGGFAAGSEKLINYLANRARSYVFSTALPAACCAAALTALEIVHNEPLRRTQLFDRAAALRKTLVEQGWNTGQSQSQIIPLLVGSPERAMRLSKQLRDAGLLIPGIRPPTVPQGESMLRISLSWRHEPSQIERLVNRLGELVEAE